MEAWRNNWFDNDGILIAPRLEPITETHRYQAGSTELLGMLWKRWKRAEESHRFLDAKFSEVPITDFSQQLPDNIRRILVSEPTEIQFQDLVANERLHDKLVQTFIQLSVETGMDMKAAGIAHPVALLPAAYISGEEAHSAISMCALPGLLLATAMARGVTLGGILTILVVLLFGYGLAIWALKPPLSTAVILGLFSSGALIYYGLAKVGSSIS
jgi:hypothetical protein